MERRWECSPEAADLLDQLSLSRSLNMSDFETNPVPEQDQQQLLAKVRSALRSEPLLGPSFHLRDLRIEHVGSLILDGEVPGVAAKKLALEHVAAVAPSVTCIGRPTASNRRSI